MNEKKTSRTKTGFSRRTFLKCAAAAGLFLAACPNSKRDDPGSPVQGPRSNRVVAVNDNKVTIWDGIQSWYGSDSFVNQARVDEMVKEGVLALTGQAAETDAWNQIIPDYRKGDKISIKINENNSGDGGNVIDPLPQLLKALAEGLKAGGVDESDIWFIDPSRRIDDRVAQPVKAAYPGVTFYGASATAYSSAGTFDSSDPALIVKHGDPNIGNSKLPDQLGSSRYLIHMPIMKAHGMAGISLTYKNLLGLFDASTIPKFHNSFFKTSNNPLVEIYANTNASGKTALIIADGIYGNWVNNYTPPLPWTVFGADSWPKRIFLSRDPVAVDCVMYDFLNWQKQNVSTESETYLVLAAKANQGTRDHWNNPADKKYSVIDFVQRDISG